MSDRAKMEPALSGGDMREILYEVFADVLGRFAFLFLSPQEGAALPLRGRDFLCASVRFAGPFSGWITLYAAPSFGVLTAANVLGVEQKAVTSEQAEDALKELVHVVCGELLEALAGRDVLFEPETPALQNVTASVCRAAVNRPGALTMLVEQEPLILEAALHHADVLPKSAPDVK